MNSHKFLPALLFVLLGLVPGAVLAASPPQIAFSATASNVVLSWTGSATLLESPVIGPTNMYSPSANQSNPQTRAFTETRFFRLGVADMPWVPPVGIPYPPMGITNTVWTYTNANYTFDYGSGPVPYRRNEFGPYTHYIDNTHPAATDTANTFGTPDKPRRTWVYPLPAGSCVQVRKGNYSFNNAPGQFMAVGGAGSEDRPIWFYGTSLDRNEMPTVTRSALHQYGNWTYLERFAFNGGCTINTRPLEKGAPVTNVVVRDCYMTSLTGSGASAFSTGGSSGNSAANYTKDFVVFRVTAHGYGDWLANEENDTAGAIMSENSTNVYILETSFFNFSGDSCRIGVDQGGTTPSGRYYYLGRNHWYDNHENALDVKHVNDAVISENVFHGFKPGSSSPGEAIVVHYGARNCFFINNIIYDCERGIASTGIEGNCYIIGNVIYNCNRYGLYLDRGGGTFYVANNTIDRCVTGIASTGIIDSLHFWNNIISDITGTASTTYHLQLDQSSIANISTATNFLFYQASGNIRVRWGGVNYATPAAWMTATGKGAGSRVGNPTYVNLAARDYRLAAGSPAIGAGAPLPDFLATFQSIFAGATGPITDIEGDVRPVGATTDIGADVFRVR